MIEQRNIALCIVLSIVTCGIYGIYWFICLVNDTNKVSNSTGDMSGGMVFLLTLVTAGIYGLYWNYKQGEKLNAAKQSRGMAPDANGILYLILALFGFGIIAWAIMQNELNKLA